MAKPIVLITLDKNCPMTNNEVNEINKNITNQLPYYHVLFSIGDKQEFQVFYEKDNKPIDIEELKELIKQK